MPIFDAGSLNQAVADTLKAADVGADQNAFVAVVTRDASGQVGVTGAFASKVGEHWTVKTAIAIEHEKRIAGGAQVVATW